MTNFFEISLKHYHTLEMDAYAQIVFPFRIVFSKSCYEIV